MRAPYCEYSRALRRASLLANFYHNCVQLDASFTNSPMMTITPNQRSCYDAKARDDEGVSRGEKSQAPSLCKQAKRVNASANGRRTFFSRYERCPFELSRSTVGGQPPAVFGSRR